ncbi:PREDICTED: uncharacterized protein LOC104747812 [Camelina sativa]|uniref:Uncharacterized protein LOC104747812 n=1 Tax=Camelina sativa TaxID=90675 RepID=A0ABM0W9Y0_CAMSA|nr:PREDICTED: uncharacterized protein LOC104747812 [Camelina sativa]
MSCLRIRLLPAKRAWKSFTANFHKFRRSKTKHKHFYRSSQGSGKKRRDRDSRIFFICLKRGCLFKKKRKAVVYVDKLFREPMAVSSWIPAKQWKPKEELFPEKGIDERAEEFITRVKAEILASRNL